jgi:hypothetical protein
MRALGANPSMTQRQKQQVLEDANEIVEPSPHTHTGGTGFAHGAAIRTRDRMQAEVASQTPPPRPRTPEQLAGEFGLADYNRLREREVREEQERLAKIARRRQQERDEVAARERKTKMAQIQFQENLVLREISDLSPDENQMFWDQFALRNSTDIEAASVIAESIRSSRKVLGGRSHEET